MYDAMVEHPILSVFLFELEFFFSLLPLIIIHARLKRPIQNGDARVRGFIGKVCWLVCLLWGLYVIGACTTSCILRLEHLTWSPGPLLVFAWLAWSVTGTWLVLLGGALLALRFELWNQIRAALRDDSKRQHARMLNAGFLTLQFMIAGITLGSYMGLGYANAFLSIAFAVFVLAAWLQQGNIQTLRRRRTIFCFATGTAALALVNLLTFCYRLAKVPGLALRWFDLPSWILPATVAIWSFRWSLLTSKEPNASNRVRAQRDAWVPVALVPLLILLPLTRVIDCRLKVEELRGWLESLVEDRFSNGFAYYFPKGIKLPQARMAKRSWAGQRLYSDTEWLVPADGPGALNKDRSHSRLFDESLDDKTFLERVATFAHERKIASTPDAIQLPVVVAGDEGARWAAILEAIEKTAAAGIGQIGFIMRSPFSPKTPRPPPSTIDDKVTEIFKSKEYDPTEHGVVLAAFCSVNTISQCYTLDRSFNRNFYADGLEIFEYLADDTPDAVFSCLCDVDLDALRVLFWHYWPDDPFVVATVRIAPGACEDCRRFVMPVDATWGQASGRLIDMLMKDDKTPIAFRVE